MKKFEDMYINYKNDVYRFLLKLTDCNITLAEELTQETFYQAIRSFNRFHGKCEVKTWLCQIAKHIYYNYLRDEKRNKRIFQYDMNIDIAGIYVDTMAENLEKKEVMIAINKIVRGLDERSRDIFEYRLYSELSYRQIANILHIKENTAKVIFCRAKAKVQEYLREVYGYEI